MARTRSTSDHPEPDWKGPKSRASGRSKASGHVWSVPLALSDVPEIGRQINLTADAPVRAAVAKLAGLRDLPRLEASFDVALHGQGGLRVTGHVRAAVGQDCVVTLEPVENEIDETVDVVFAPEGARSAGGDAEEEAGTPDDEAPEPLVGGMVDLGAIATEFLLLAIDPYPRAPGVEFAPPEDGEQAPESPFAVLKGLKSGL